MRTKTKARKFISSRRTPSAVSNLYVCRDCDLSHYAHQLHAHTHTYLLKNTVAALFEAMSRAALLNPDPEEPGTNEGDDELIFDQQALEGMGEEQVSKNVCVCAWSDT